MQWAAALTVSTHPWGPPNRLSASGLLSEAERARLVDGLSDALEAANGPLRAPLAASRERTLHTQRTHALRTHSRGGERFVAHTWCPTQRMRTAVYTYRMRMHRTQRTQRHITMVACASASPVGVVCRWAPTYMTS